MAGEYDWLGPLIGGALGGYGSSQGTTQTQGVAPEFQPLANAVSQRGMEIGNMGYTPYQGNLVAGFNPYQYAGFDMAAQRAMRSGGLNQQAESSLGQTLGGNYLGSGNPYAGANPYLEQNIQNTLGDVAKTYNQTVAPTMAATAYKSGSFGNAGQAEMEAASRDQLQRNMGRISGDMRMQDYGRQQDMWQQERNRMMQGLSMAPSIYGLGYAPSQYLQGIGGAMQAQGQKYLDADYSQFQQAQQWPFKTYDAMLAPFSTRAVGSSTTESSSPWAAALGGAMIGQRLWGAPSPTRATTYPAPYVDPTIYPWEG